MRFNYRLLRLYLEAAMIMRGMMKNLASGAASRVTGDQDTLTPAHIFPSRSDTLNTSIKMITVQEPSLQLVMRDSTPG